MRDESSPTPWSTNFVTVRSATNRDRSPVAAQAESDLVARTRSYQTEGGEDVGRRVFDAAIAALRDIERMPGAGSPRAGYNAGGDCEDIGLLTPIPVTLDQPFGEQSFSVEPASDGLECSIAGRPTGTVSPHHPCRVFARRVVAVGRRF